MTKFNIDNILSELKAIAFGGLAPEEIDAKINEAVQPLKDKQAADEVALSAIQSAVADLQNGVSDADTAIQAIVDALPKAAPHEEAPAPAEDAGVDAPAETGDTE